METIKTVKKIIENSVLKPDTGCWIWQGAPRKGYGRVRVGGKQIAAHRASYEAFVEDVPDCLCLDHLCRITLSEVSSFAGMEQERLTRLIT